MRLWHLYCAYCIMLPLQNVLNFTHSCIISGIVTQKLRSVKLIGGKAVFGNCNYR
jgi:hypothetical protein